jgi:hypothetical protein
MRWVCSALPGGLKYITAYSANLISVSPEVRSCGSSAGGSSRHARVIRFNKRWYVVKNTDRGLMHTHALGSACVCPSTSAQVAIAHDNPPSQGDIGSSSKSI